MTIRSSRLKNAFASASVFAGALFAAGAISAFVPAEGSPALCAQIFASPEGVLDKAAEIHRSNLYLTMSEVGGDAGTFGLLARARGGLANTLFKFEVPHAKEYSKTMYPSADPRAVSEARLAAVLEKSHAEMISILTATTTTATATATVSQSLGTKRLAAFANTAMTTQEGPGQAWLGIRLPLAGEIFEIRLHATLTTEKNIVRQQKSLGALGLNLIHGAATRLTSAADLRGPTVALESLLRELTENQPRAGAVNVNDLAIYRVTGVGLERVKLEGPQTAVMLLRTGAARSVFVRNGELVDPATLLYGKKVETLDVSSADLATLATAAPAQGSLAVAVLVRSSPDAQTAREIARLNQLGYVVSLRSSEN